MLEISFVYLWMQELLRFELAGRVVEMTMVELDESQQCNGCA